MAQVKVKDGSLYVYTHWDGHRFEQMAKDALEAARPRLGDDAYSLRIVVDQLTKDSRDQETGCGLMLTPSAEDEYNGDKPSIIIDLIEGTVQRIGSRT